MHLHQYSFSLDFELLCHAHGSIQFCHYAHESGKSVHLLCNKTLLQNRPSQILRLVINFIE